MHNLIRFHKVIYLIVILSASIKWVGTLVLSQSIYVKAG
jgi:hypothetical protein